MKAALFQLLALVLAGTLRAAGPDLAAPAFQDIRKAWLQEKASLDSARTRTYRDLLETRVQELELEIQEKTASRNVKGMSVARKAKSISEEALASVQSNGTFRLPENVRRELDDWVKKLTDEKGAADKQADESLATLRARYRSRFAQVLALQAGAPAPDDAALEALFDQLLATEPKKADPPPAASTNAPGEGGPAAADSPWFAASGEGTAWFTLGTMTCDIMAQDVFSVPILNVTNSYKASKTHPLNGQTSPVTYESLRALSMEEGNRCAFRLKRVADRQPVTVLAWPTTANRGRLEFRSPPLPFIPYHAGFAIEACITNTQVTPGVASVDVQIESDPAGAEIRLNNRLTVDSSGQPLLTPARLRVPAVPSALRLTKKDHVAKTLDKWTPQPNQKIALKLQHETALPPTKTLKLDPSKGWTAAEVSIKSGDRIWIVPSGQWTIGSRSEMCGPDGYPDTQKFAHYLATGDDPRQKPDAPYGCLLVRLSAMAEPQAVTGPVCIQTPSAGALFFDVNEKTAKESRRDNRGILTVTVIVIPL